MTNSQIIELANKYPITLKINEEDCSKTIATSPVAVTKSIESPLDLDFLAFLARGDHLNEAILPFTI